MNFFEGIKFTFNKNNRNYVLQEIYKTNNVEYIKELIEKTNSEIIDYEILSSAVSRGYQITDNTPIPKSLKGLIIQEYGGSPDSLIKFAIENDSNMSIEVFAKAVQYGKYEINENTKYIVDGDVLSSLKQIEEGYLNNNDYTIGQWKNLNVVALPYIIERLDYKDVTFDILKEAVRLGYRVNEKTPIPKLFSSEEIEKLIESVNPLSYEETQDYSYSERRRDLLKNEYYHLDYLVSTILDKNANNLTYDILDNFYNKFKNGYIQSRIPVAVASVDEVIRVINNSSNIKTVNKLIQSLPEYLMNDSILQLAIDKGYVIDNYQTPEYLKNNEKLVKVTEQCKIIEELKGASNSYDLKRVFEKYKDRIRIDELPEIWKKELNEIGMKILDYGYNYQKNNNNPKFLCQFKFIKKAFENGQKDCLKYCYDQNLTFEEEKWLIDNGYIETAFNPLSIRNLESIEYAIEHGHKLKETYINNYLGELYNQVDFKEKERINNLVSKLIEYGFEIYSDSPSFMLTLDNIKKSMKNLSQISGFILNEFYNYYKGASEEEKEELDAFIFTLIEEGKRIYNNLFRCGIAHQHLGNLKYIKKALECSQWEAINFIIENKLTDEEKDLILRLIPESSMKDESVKFNEFTPNFFKNEIFVNKICNHINNGDYYRIRDIDQEKITKSQKEKINRTILSKLENGDLRALYFLDISIFTKDQIHKLHPYLKEYVSSKRIVEIMIVINKFDFKDIEYLFNKEQLICFKYLFKFKDIYTFDTIDNFYKNSLENKELCNQLFTAKRWNTVFSLICDKDEMAEILTNNQKKIIFIYEKLDERINDIFQNYIMDNLETVNTMTDEKLNLIEDVLIRLLTSNSTEMQHSIKSLANQILILDDPMDGLNKIEDIFLKNNLPTIGKIYKIFEILHPDFKGFNFSNQSSISPVLQSKSNSAREIIIFADLMKSCMGSNNRNFKRYLEILEQGNGLFIKLCDNKTSFDNLDDESKRILEEYVSHLNTLYNNTKKGKIDNRELTGNIISDIAELKKLFSSDGKLTYDLPDRIIKMYCHFAGIDTLEQAKRYMNDVIEKANKRNIIASESDLKLEQGDFVKGIGDIKYLSNILQNGSVAREFLGSSAGSDATPLDTDLSKILESNDSVEDAISKTEANGYGPIWFVLKNRDNRFAITRRSPNEQNQQIDSIKDNSKLEAFFTGAVGYSHYGIRTGFASSDIDYIVMENFDHRVGLEIALNGFYIPVADKTGKIVFTYDDYKAIREKMSGLSYYDMDKYNISINLVSPEIIETKKKLDEDMVRTNAYVSEINKLISKALIASGIRETVNGFSNNLIPGIAEIYPTGSTSRNTNVPNDSDFDYVVKIDRDTYFDNEKLSKFKQKMKDVLEFSDGPGGKICGKVKKNNGDILDVEISFCPRTDKVEFSTDVSLKDRIDTIKEQYPESYTDVLANIVYAKKLFKSVNAYKSSKSDSNQGGLGGIGIENWILQHGGSLYDAAKSFISASEKAGSFEEFCKIYQVYDFGANHYSDKSGIYEHDNFVGDDGKMTKNGYNRMLDALKRYVYSYENLQNVEQMESTIEESNKRR